VWNSRLRQGFWRASGRNKAPAFPLGQWKLTPFFAAVVIAVGLWNRPTTAELNGTASMVADAVRQYPNRILLSLVDRDL
jgi:hypothetical protein